MSKWSIKPVERASVQGSITVTVKVSRAKVYVGMKIISAFASKLLTDVRLEFHAVNWRFQRASEKTNNSAIYSLID